MSYQVRYAGSFDKDLRKLDPPAAQRIIAFLTDRIEGTSDPRQYGQALKGSRLGSLWRYRVGDYRIIADIQDDTLTVLALHTGHRRDVYSDR